MNVTVDSSIIHKSDEPFCEEHWDCIKMLQRIEEFHTLVMDHQRQILKEWDSNISVPGSFAQQWWTRMLYSTRTQWVDGKLPNRLHVQAEEGGCHRKDFPYLAVSHRSGSTIVHEDSDYELPAIAELGIRALRVSQALKVISAAP